MLRSGVPPHIGQSPLPGSDAESDAAPIARRATTSMRNRMVISMCLIGGSTGPALLACGRRLVRRHLEIIQVRAELRVDEQARCALTVADRVHLLDRPRRGLRLADRPR